ncbi:hypothetical protein Bbelb_212910 [Branchiostoma belcheri]|nr:hypothetical protein Bbelb_212910 [Branchiostoma belcheri]
MAPFWSVRTNSVGTGGAERLVRLPVASDRMNRSRVGYRSDMCTRAGRQNRPAVGQATRTSLHTRLYMGDEFCTRSALPLVEPDREAKFCSAPTAPRLSITGGFHYVTLHVTVFVASSLFTLRKCNMS